ncbi:HlyD family secretion protein [Limobrevibacterium gyesilva]|uniref:HlyD family secretion protein n=1 Tax=Limobrevibacterium gyesilva TaxID=2991712 RepID=A0AA42CEM1_9PROT|nr:HlyD family secretion protein [Limobrevibacterium gyesilva]MCW3475459.1 HlyD family secretion protein [Limobrevibacterium gyesilva]
MNAVSDKPAAAVGSQSSPGPRRSRWTGKAMLRTGGAVVLLIGLAATANWWLAEGRFIESTDNAYVQGDIVVLGPRIEGDVAAIHVADNQVVKAGDPLITLDPADWQARLDQARGNAAEVAAAAATTRRQVELSRAAIAQADAAVAQAQAEVTRAAAEAGRSGALVGAGWTSRQANEQAVADARKAEAALASARAQRATAEQGLAVAEAQVVQADARRPTAEAAVRLAESNLSYTVIRAPFDGVVGNRAAQLGQHVMVGQQLIAVAPPAQRLFVVANFKETQLRRMRPGQKVVLSADIDSGAEVHGRVDSLAPATGALFSLLPPENATGNFTKVVQRVPVKIVLEPAEAKAAHWLRAGLSVTAEVDTRGADAERLGFLGTAAATLRLR